MSLKVNKRKMTKSRHHGFKVVAIATANMILLLILTSLLWKGIDATSGASDCDAVAGTETFQPSASDYFFGPMSSDKEITPFEWQTAAENGNEWAQCRMGDYYASGRDGFCQDIDEAIKWWFMALEQGNAVARYRLAKYYWIKGFVVWREQHF